MGILNNLNGCLLLVNHSSLQAPLLRCLAGDPARAIVTRWGEESPAGRGRGAGGLEARGGTELLAAQRTAPDPSAFLVSPFLVIHNPNTRILQLFCKLRLFLVRIDPSPLTHPCAFCVFNVYHHDCATANLSFCSQNTRTLSTFCSITIK